MKKPTKKPTDKKHINDFLNAMKKEAISKYKDASTPQERDKNLTDLATAIIETLDDLSLNYIEAVSVLRVADDMLAEARLMKRIEQLSKDAL